jgi:mono/diheme cytochrome c family protein
LACAGCHGGDGRGISWIENSALGALTMSDEDYFAMLVRRGDITAQGMHPPYMLISDDELRAAIAYMRTLGTGN